MYIISWVDKDGGHECCIKSLEQLEGLYKKYEFKNFNCKWIEYCDI